MRCWFLFWLGAYGLFEGRFTLGDVRRRLEAEIAPLERPELREAVTLLRATLDEVDAAWDPGLPGGVIHGDLFRDNLRWEGDAVVGVLDWESASDGLWVYDLAVTQLAWCYGDALSEPLLRAMERGYASVRPLEPAERRFLRIARLAAAAPSACPCWSPTPSRWARSRPSSSRPATRSSPTWPRAT